MEAESESVRYQVVVPKEWRDALLESINEAAKEEGRGANYSVEEGDSKKAESELQFDPVAAAIVIKAGLYVGNVIVQGVAGYFVQKGVERLVAKIHRSKEAGSPTTGPEGASKIPIVVRPPSGNAEAFNALDSAAAEKAFARLTADAD